MLEFAKRNVVVFVYSALVLSTLLVFWQVRNFDFVNYDDDRYVYENPHVLNGLTTNGIAWAFTTGHTGYWHPITWLSLMLDYQLFGKWAGGYHLVSVFFHIVNTLLLFHVLRRMTGAVWSGAFVAAAFALHPLHVESVAWIAERKDVLSVFFWLLTIWAYLRYVKRPCVVRYLPALLAFALGLMAKPMLVTLPFVLLLLDYWPLVRVSYERRIIYHLIREKIPFFALAAVSSVITFFAQRSSGAITYSRVFPLRFRVANAFLSFAKYIGRLFLPRDLAVFYPFDAHTIQFWLVVLCILLMAVVSVLVIWFGRKRKYLFVGWFWFVGTLIPVIGLIQVGQQSLADRYTYVPYIGLFIMIAWGLPQLLSKWPQRKIALGLSMVIVLTALGICSHRQVSFWKNSFTLFSHAAEVTQNNYIAYHSLGAAYNNLGRCQEAIESYKQAVRIMPDYASVLYSLGLTYYKLGRYQDAAESYKRVVRINPDYADACVNLGATLYQLGRYQDSAESYKQAIKIRPANALAHYNLGVACDKLGRYQDAIEAYKQAARLKPNEIETHFNLGLDYFKLGDKDSALGEYKILKTLNPEQANKFFNMINK